MVGTVSRDGGGGLAGQFRAELASAAAFVKERPAFAKFEPSPDAPVLELNGRARWQVRGGVANASHASLKSLAPACAATSMPPELRLAEAQQGVIANALLLLRYLSFAFPQVERERDGGVRPAAPIRNADEQGSVYMKLAGNPVDTLKGITGYH
jgi:hypothetical protein